MFALNVKDGLVIIDEPELHLHPRWQRIFLSLFREVADDRNNQFVVATHSPVFVAPDTMNDVTRIYRSDGASQRVLLRDVELPEKKSLVRMINSQNNERMFFADKVVLVEGITDRLVMTSLVDGVSARMASNEAVEVIDVGGKHNFKDYKALLAALRTPAYIMADRDYLRQVGGEAIKSLFVHDDGKS
jgi:putative ATP-dependent endonuclease of OLD family